MVRRLLMKLSIKGLRIMIDYLFKGLILEKRLIYVIF